MAQPTNGLVAYYPFNGNATVVNLIVYDALGREVTTLVNEELKPGTYRVDWDASHYSGGVYFYTFKLEILWRRN
jgi:hypothetical protein